MGEEISANLSELSGAESNATGCSYEFAEDLNIRFPLLVIFTSSVCAFGVLGNLLSIYVLTRPDMRSTSNFYLVILAVYDIGVLVCYVLLYIVEVAYDYTRDFEVHRSWFGYLAEVYLASHILQGVAMYSTVAATVERWIALGFPRVCGRFTCTNRKILLSTVMILVFVAGAQMPRYFEVKIVRLPQCDGQFGMFQLEPSELALNADYVSIYSVWVSGIVFCFLPFSILLTLNLGVFYKLSLKRPAQCSMLSLTPWAQRIEDRIRKRKTREATVVLLIVVFIFLICNLPGLVLAIMEQTCRDFLFNHSVFYSYFRDCINILAVINSSANFVVYVLFGRDFRRELRRIPKNFRKLYGKAKRRKRKPAANSVNGEFPMRSVKSPIISKDNYTTYNSNGNSPGGATNDCCNPLINNEVFL